MSSSYPFSCMTSAQAGQGELIKFLNSKINKLCQNGNLLQEKLYTYAFKYSLKTIQMRIRIRNGTKNVVIFIC